MSPGCFRGGQVQRWQSLVFFRLPWSAWHLARAIRAPEVAADLAASSSLAIRLQSDLDQSARGQRSDRVLIWMRRVLLPQGSKGIVFEHRRIRPWQARTWLRSEKLFQFLSFKPAQFITGLSFRVDDWLRQVITP